MLQCQGYLNIDQSIDDYHIMACKNYDKTITTIQSTLQHIVARPILKQVGGGG
jgi:hypothetical protein